MAMRLPLALAGVLVLGGHVLAHDRSGNPNWIADGHFTSPIDGSHCCGIADCVELHPDDVMQTNIRDFWIKSMNELVPEQEVQNSRDGNYWRCKKPDGSRRCFFAPPPST
jgi:hypothetical protein